VGGATTGDFAQVGFLRTAIAAGFGSQNATWANEPQSGTNAGYWGILAVIE
jgi:hypothetical protein